MVHSVDISDQRRLSSSDPSHEEHTTFRRNGMESSATIIDNSSIRGNNNSISMPARTRSRSASLRSQLFNRTSKANNHLTTTIELASSPHYTNPPVPSYRPHHTDISEEPLFPYDDGSNPKKDSKYSFVNTQEVLPNYSSWASRKMKNAKIQTHIQHFLMTFRKFILRKHQIAPSENGRIIPIEVAYDRPPLIDERTSRPYCSNVITSSVYTPYTFLPRQLYAQFSKLANLYFIFVSILQMIPSWSTTGTYTTIIPLMVFISISMGREGFDDWRRHRQDKQENNRTTRIAELNNRVDDDEPIVYTEIPWMSLKVGDIVKINQNEWVPADVVLISSEGEDGLSYIETMDLDGETNLKSREALPELAELANSSQKLASLKAEIVTEDPNLDLYNFEATVMLGSKRYPLSSSHVIYRGSILRNTPSVLGIVIFSGQETKIRMNAIQDARTKAPRLQKKVNGIVIFMVIFVIGLSVFSLIAATVYYSTTGSHMWYLTGLQVGTVPNLMGFIIMYNTLIPLSLYVSLEIIKVSQMLILQMDIDMYHEESNTPCEARTATINEELGQVSYIFSDKTGTLTDNIMIFRKLSVAGYAWLHDLDIQLQGEENKKLFHKVQDAIEDVDQKRSKGKEVKVVVPHQEQNKKSYESSRPSIDVILRQVAALPRKSSSTAARRPSNVRIRPSMNSIGRASSIHSSAWKSTANPAKVQSTRSSLELLQYLQIYPNSIYAKRARFFLLSIALCHSCLPEPRKKGEEDLADLDYSSASPDEIALVSAARDLGFIVIDRQHHSVTVRTYPNGFDKDPVNEVYQILETIEFSSSRKRMSVIVKFPDGRISIFCKGADNIIMERLRQSKLALAKSQEISKQATMRKAAEADLVIARNSISSPVTGHHHHYHHHNQPSNARISLGRPSINIDQKDALASLDEHFHRVHHEDEVEQIAESSRRSMTFARQRKYGEGRTSRDLTRKSRESILQNRISVDDKHKNVISPTFDEETESDGDELQIDEHLVLNEAYVIERTLEHIDEFSTEGLRTLLYGYRFMEKEEFDGWNKLYDDARTSLVNRQENIEKVGEGIERDFEMCGATAIEDKLQEGVPEAIDKLRRANIKLWMLTGDKRETAINIGYSCRLIKDYSTVVILRHDDGDVAGKMAAAMLSLDGGHVAHCVVVVDGMTLSHIESDMTLMTLFIDLGVKADSVICCRASPAQKSSMVSAVRNKVKSAITLAIGDGANDIAMIRSADVGIGITGKEGLQAARSSDYSIAQFRFLLKLLFVHGRWNYVRICKYVLSTFYKELLFYLTQAIYQRNTLFTGTSIYESWSLSMFNTLFTSLPVLCMGICERDLNPSTLIAIPELYAKGQQNQGFSLLIFLGWMVVAASQSVSTSFLVYYLYGFEAVIDNTIYPLGVLSFTAALLLITFKLQLLEMHSITAINVAVIVISVGGWFVWCMFLSYIYGKTESKVYFVHNAIFDLFGRDMSWWSSILVIFAIGFVFDIGIQCVRRQIASSETELFQQLEKDPSVRQRLEQESFYELQNTMKDRKWESDIELNASGSLQPMQPLPEVERPPMARKRDILKKTLTFGRRKTSGEYEREIEEILERRRQMEWNELS